MPHVTLEGALDLARLQQTLCPAEERTSGGVRRVKNAYLNAPGRTLLLEAVVMESGVSRSFFLRIDTKAPRRYTVRIEPIVAVDRTGGVIDAVAWIARRILEAEPDCAVSRTNIPGFDARESPT